MATSTNTIKTRIQLKSDTEANWNKAGPKEGSTGFVPLLGELIVYTPDATHPFSRLKIGDGVTNVVALPFIDSGTLNGEENFNFSVDKTTIKYLTNWVSGIMTEAKIENNIFKIRNGTVPTLGWEQIGVVTNVTKEVT